MKQILAVLLIITSFLGCKKDPSAVPPQKPMPAATPIDTTLQISIYPNPSTGVFTIKTNDTKPDSIEISNVLGNKIIDQTITGTTVFDLIGIQNGLYFVKIKGRGTTIIRKIIIQH